MRVGSDEEVNSEERRGSGSGSVGDGGGGGNDGDDGVIGVDGAVINQYILLTQWRNDVESPPERARSLSTASLSSFSSFLHGYFQLGVAAY